MAALESGFSSPAAGCFPSLFASVAESEAGFEFEGSSESPDFWSDDSLFESECFDVGFFDEFVKRLGIRTRFEIALFGR